MKVNINQLLNKAMKLKISHILAIFLFYSSILLAQNSDNFNYNQFKLYFDDLKEQGNMDEKLIPNNSSTKFLYRSGDEREKIYGRTKISYPNGYDLFIIRNFLDYNDEELSNTDFLSYLIFHDGKLAGEYYCDSLYRVLEIYTGTDGGSIEQSFEIEKDSSFLIDYYHYDCCSSTGFDTPVETKTKARYRVDCTGQLELQDVLEVQFSSPFFDMAFLEEKKKETNFNYPTQDDYYNLAVKNMIQEIPIFKDGIQLHFYIELINNVLYPVFIIYDKRNNIAVERLDIKYPSLIKSKYLDSDLIKCPITIKFGNSDIKNPAITEATVKNKAITKKLTGIISYHKTDWTGITIANLYAKELEIMLDNVINKLTGLKKDRLKILKERITASGFWNDIAELKSKTEVFYFHPIAFVEQMKKMAETVNKGIIFHIYQDGRIEKHIPDKDVSLAFYYYYESSGIEHYLGQVNFQKKNWRNTGGSEKKKGRDGKELSYCDLTNYSNLTSYSSGNVKKMHPSSLGSKRYYIDIDALACLIGALIEESIEDLFFSGFSIEDGNTAGGSSSHLNGMVGDFGYFSKDKKPSSIHLSLKPDITNPELNPNYDYEREKKFCNALHKFGYARYNGKKLLTENVYEKVNGKYENRILPYALHYAVGSTRHYHHLHIQGLKLSEILTIKPI